MPTARWVTGDREGTLAKRLAARSDVALAQASVESFPDGERRVRLEGWGDGEPIALLQALGAPTGERLLELGLLADAARRGGARRLLAVVPYLGYARQDRRGHGAESLGAAVVARLVASCGFERVLGVDVHAAALEGFFSCPFDNLTAEPLLAQALVEHAHDGVIVAPDLGAAKLGRRYAQRLDLPLAIVHKTRLSAQEVTVGHLVGDVRGRRPILVDDMISTGTTIAAAFDAVLAAGARPDGMVVASHGVFSGAWEELLTSRGLLSVVVTDSVEPMVAARQLQVQRVSLAPLLAEAVSRIAEQRSLDGLLASA